MKSLLSLLLPIIAMAPSSISAAAEAAGPAAAGMKAVFVDPNSSEVAEIRTLGERAVNRVGVSLVNEVNAAIKKDGLEKAVDVCHLKNVPSAGKVIEDMPRITALKRTSLQLRNPANAPDAADLMALNRVQSALKGDEEPPKVLVQKVELGGGKIEWRVYRPLGLRPECVHCHGEKDKLSAGVRKILEERYPTDQATGYSAGQWRGLVRVTVAAGNPPPGGKK